MFKKRGAVRTVVLAVSMLWVLVFFSQVSVSESLEMWWYSPSATIPYFDEIFDQFEAEEPGIKVDRQYFATWPEAFQKLQIGIAAGKTPDMIRLKESYAYPIATAGGLTDLSDYLSKSEVVNLESVPESLRKLYTVGGKVYGMPLNGPILGLFYNKDLFAAAGLPVDAGPQNWSDLRDYAEKLRVPEKDQWGFAVYEYGTREFNLTWFITFIWEAGGKFWKDDYTGVALDSPEAVEALQFLVDLIYQDKTLLPPGVPKEGLVESNKIGMWIQGNWGMKFYANAAPDLNYGTALLPKHRTHGQYVSSDGLLIPEPAKNKDLGWRLIEFLLRPDVNAQLNLRDSFLPVNSITL